MKTLVYLAERQKNALLYSTILATFAVSTYLKKSCFKPPHLSANPQLFLTCTRRFAVGGFLCELRLQFMVSRSYLRWRCLAKKGPSYPAFNPFRMLSDEHVEHIHCLLTLVKIYGFPHTMTLRHIGLLVETAVLIFTRIDRFYFWRVVQTWNLLH